MTLRSAVTPRAGLPLLLRNACVLDTATDAAGSTRLRPGLSLLVEGESLAWIGATADEPPARECEVRELSGRLVTPAFVDAHAHLAMTGLQALGVDLAPARSAAEALELVAMHARTTGLGVVLAHSWDESRWVGPLLTRAELDEAVGGRPAYVSRVDLHSAFASTALLEAARTHQGQRTDTLDGWSEQGPVTRGAHHAVRDALRQVLSVADRTAAIRHALLVAAARGIGLVHELGAPHISDPQDLPSIDRLRAEAAREGGALPEVVGYWGEIGALDRVRELGYVGAAGDICMDGALGSRTAALHEPYLDAATSGHLYLSAAEVADHVVACTHAGMQAGFHVIGDRAAAEVVAGFEIAASKVGTEQLRAARHRLEHLEMVTPDQLGALGRLGVTASVQPMFDALWGGEDGLYAGRLGDRARHMNPLADAAAAGLLLAFGSDSPVTPFDPWAAVRAAMWHHHPGQRLDLGTALRAHTVGGWQAAGLPEGGRLAVGAPASLAVWDVPAWHDTREAAPDVVAALPTVQPPSGLAQALGPDQPLPTCLLTVVSGSVAYDAGVLGPGEQR